MMAFSTVSQAAAQLFRASWTEWTAGAVVLAIVYSITTIVYNLYFHPLRHFPGPRFHAATSLAWGISNLRGTLPLDVHAHHETYGPVFRLRPNELAFADAPAWQDIYGHKVLGKKAGLAPGVRELPKHRLFYQSYPGQPESIVTAGYEKHAKWRRILAPSFSEKSLRAQEPLVTRYVDLLMARLRERGGEALDIVMWYNWTTFDVIGDLAFGDSFGCLENAQYHPFVSVICTSMKQASRLVFLRYMGLQTLSLALLFGLMRGGFKLRGFGTKTLKKRLASGATRPDLIQPLIEGREEAGMSFGSLSAMASALLLAGSETTASSLSGVTWLLLSNPEKLAKLTAEVRGAFNDESEINFTSVQGLGYMLACLNEGLRMYSPVAGGLPRVVPKGGALISGNYVPEGSIVGVYHWSASHLSSNWTDPNKFVPERFLGEERYRDDKQASLKPFVVGPRDCIGKNLAYTEMRLILARLIWNFDLKLADDVHDWIGEQENYLLWKKLPLKVVLTPVER